MLDSINENSKEDLLLFEEFKQTVLIEGNSFFNKKIRIFSEKNFSTFEDRYIKNYISDKNYSFLEKIDLQTSNTTDSFKHLFANYLWLYNYFFSSIRNHRYYKVGRTFEAKIKDVSFLLGKDLNENFFPKYGFANCGISYNQNKYEELCVIHSFIKKLSKEKDLINREEDLENVIKSINVKNELEFYHGKEYKKAGIKSILLFLLFPNKYEPIVSYTDKEMIVEHFLEERGDDIDKDILKIRKQYNIKTSFYVDDLIYKWNKNKQLTQIIKNKFQLGDIKLKEFNKIEKISVLADEDFQEKEKNKRRRGLEAEEIVFCYYKEYIKKIKDPSIILNILRDLKLINFSKMHNILSRKSIGELCHYSKYIDTYAPFDLICPIDRKVFFIEVKSTMDGSTIYLSYNELRFAVENINNYLLIVVFNGKIYEVEELNDNLVIIYEKLESLKKEFSFLEINKIKIALKTVTN